MGVKIDKELAALRRMTAGELRAKYEELFGERSRSGNRDWLFRRCAWRVQALAEGGLSERARQRAKELARERFIKSRKSAQWIRRFLLGRASPDVHRD